MHVHAHTYTHTLMCGVSFRHRTDEEGIFKVLRETQMVFDVWIMI